MMIIVPYNSNWLPGVWGWNTAHGVRKRSILNEVDKGTHLDQVMIETTGSGHSSMSAYFKPTKFKFVFCVSLPSLQADLLDLHDDVFECFWYFPRIDSEHESNGAGSQWEEWQIPFQLCVRRRLRKCLKKWRVAIKNIGITVGILKSGSFFFVIIDKFWTSNGWSTKTKSPIAWAKREEQPGTRWDRIAMSGLHRPVLWPQMTSALGCVWMEPLRLQHLEYLENAWVVETNCIRTCPVFKGTIFIGTGESSQTFWNELPSDQRMSGSMSPVHGWYLIASSGHHSCGCQKHHEALGWPGVWLRGFQSWFTFIDIH